jgi:hypothetical protein
MFLVIMFCSSCNNNVIKQSSINKKDNNQNVGKESNKEYKCNISFNSVEKNSS